MKNLIPRFIHDHFKAENFHGRFDAVSIFVDISGFTAMTESLMQHGKEGAEILAETLLAVFDPLVNAVYGYDGIVCGFAGDAFTAVFPFPQDPGASRLPLEAGPYMRALATASVIQRSFVKCATRQTKFGAFNFAAKVGLADGTVEWSIIRSEEAPYQYAYFFRGTAVEACAHAENQAVRGDLLMSAATHSVLRSMIQTEVGLQGHYKVVRITGQLPRAATAAAWQADLEVLTAFFPPELVHASAHGEFRWITTVFLGLNEQTGVDRLERFVQCVFRLLRQYRGTLTQVHYGDKGCNLLIFWGAPTTFENNVERSLGFLLDLKGAFAIGRSASGAHTSFSAAEGGSEYGQFRAGVTLQLMYAGFAGGSLQGEFTCYGRGINLAARMMTKSPWGQVWLDSAAAKAAESLFEITDLEHQDFKGFQSLQAVHALTGRTHRKRTIAYIGQMVGRRKEFNRLNDFLLPAVGMPGRFAGVAVVYGEPGLGKSRLIHEVNQSILQGPLLWWIYCPTNEILRLSLHPFRHFLRTFFHQSPYGSEAANRRQFQEQFDVLRHQLRRPEITHTRKDAVIAELDRTRPILMGMIDLFEKDSLWTQLEPQLLFENMLLALKNLIKALCLIRPVVVFIEDLQWLDAESHEFLRVLTRTMPAENFPLAILISSRYLDDHGKPALNLAAGVERLDIELAALHTAATRQIAEAVAELPVDEEVISFLQGRTAGNPFFTEQMTISLLEQGALVQRNGVLHHRDSAFSEIPATITAVLIARLDRLPLPVKRVVQTAAVLGDAFDLPLLCSMLADDADVEFKVAQAVEAAILRTHSDGHYIFRHTLMHEAAYQMQLRARLRQLHSQAAVAYENLFANNLAPHSAELAHHYQKAEITDKAIVYLEKAGDYAKGQYQNRAAIDYYDNLLEIVQPAETTALQAQILRKKAAILILIGEWAEAEKLLLSAIATAQQLANVLEEANSQLLLGQLLNDKGVHLKAQPLLTEALTHFIVLADQHGKGATLCEIGRSFKNQGDHEKAIVCFREALELATESNDSKGMHLALTSMGVVDAEQGRYEQAETNFQRQLEVAEEVGNKAGLGRALANLGILKREQGSYGLASEFVRRRIVLCEEVGDKRGITAALMSQGILQDLQNNWDQALICYQQSLTMAEEMGDQIRIGLVLSNMGMVYEAQGDIQKAMSCYERYLAFAREAELRRDISVALGYMGRCNYALRDLGKAEECLAQAVAMSKELNLKYFLKGQLYTLAEVYVALEKFAEAGTLISEAMSVANEIKDHVDIFKFKLLATKIETISSGRSDALFPLLAMLDEATDDEHKAFIHYEIWSCLERFKNLQDSARVNPEEHRLAALELLTKLYQKIPKYSYRIRMAEMAQSAEQASLATVTSHFQTPVPESHS